jgi:hypothetical protein
MIVGFPATAWVYFPLELQAGVLPPDGDTIALPMAGSILTATLLAPVVLGVTSLCLHWRTDSRRILGWRRDRPVIAALGTLLFGIPAAWVAVTVGLSLLQPQPLYEYLWLPFMVCLIAWLLILRAEVAG